MERYHVCVSIIYGYSKDEGHWATFLCDNVDEVIKKASVMYDKMMIESSGGSYHDPQMIIGCLKNIDNVKDEVTVQQIYIGSKACLSSDQLNNNAKEITVKGWVMTAFTKYCDEVGLFELLLPSDNEDFRQ